MNNYISQVQPIDKKEKYNNVFLTLYILSILLPASGAFLAIKPLMCLIMWAFCSGSFGKIDAFVFSFFGVWFGCVFLGQMVYVGEPHVDAVLHEFVRIGSYFCITIGLIKLKISRKTLTILCGLLLTINFAVQLLQFFKVEAVFDFLRKYYMQGEDFRHLNLAYGTTLASFRSGSIFINPNVYTPIALMCLAVLFANLDINIRSNSKLTVASLVFVFVGGGSLLLTGSRTALAALILLIGFFAIRVAGKRPFLVGFILMLLVAVLVWLTSEGARTILFSEGMDDSVSVKWSELWRYITEVNPLSYFVGNSTNIGSNRWGFDVEWGYVLVYTGIVGIVNYLRLHRTLLYKSSSTNGIIYKYILLVFIAQTLSATVLYNYYAYPLFAIFVFTKGIYDE